MCLSRFLICGLFLLCFFSNLKSQETDDAIFIKNIYNKVLQDGSAYQWLNHLTTQIGGRLSGSPQAAEAVDYTRAMLDSLGLDSVWLQPCEVPHWIRGEKEEVHIVTPAANINLPALALGNSVATPPSGITAEIIEVRSLDEVEKLGAKNIKGKIVFFNRPMDPTQIRTFNAYGGAVDQRVNGPSEAARYGAVATLVRSMTTLHDDHPHTGVMVNKEGINKIPAVAISTNAAEMLHKMLLEKKVTVYMKTNCQTLDPVQSYNVIGEIKGSTYPDEIILVGGHLDSWDVGQGAHDDGAGCVHAMEVIRTLKELNYQPKRTLRCVLFMNEENGLAGGLAYAEAANKKGEMHLAAVESDAGGFTPRGFSCDAENEVFADLYLKLQQWLPLLEPYGLMLTKGGSGADISPLKSQRGLLVGFRPDSQRYFDYHHTATDTFDAVNQRELELGAAAITALIYLIDKHGL